MIPVLAVRLKPAGKVPDTMDQLKGAVPPLVAKVWLYTAPTVAPGKVVVVTMGTTLTIIDKFWSSNAVPASVTRTVKLAVPAVVGVPEMIPVLAARLKPAGKVPVVIDHVNGVVPPLTPNVWLYPAPTVAPGKVVVVMTKPKLIVSDKA
jgi:hypothetical protein